MKQKARVTPFKVLVWVTFSAFFLWWLYITVSLRHGDHNSVHNQVFAATYGVMAVLGGIIGLVASKQWGGRKSLVGRALLFFAIGLLLQEFGQVTYSVYLYLLNGEIPYPSIGDIGYFGSVLVYIYAVWQLAKAAGVRFALRNRTKQTLVIILPLALLAVSYVYFLRGYQFDFSSAKAFLKVFLDFGYPFGQAIYIAIALLTLILSRNLLGGVMRNKIMLVLFALCVQYGADFSFLYANKAGTLFPGGANDFVYLLAYTAMALALNSFRTNLGATQAAGKLANEEPKTNGES